MFLEMDSYVIDLTSSKQFFEQFDIELHESVEFFSQHVIKKVDDYGTHRKDGYPGFANKISILKEKWKSQLPWFQEVHEDMKGSVSQGKMFGNSKFYDESRRGKGSLLRKADGFCRRSAKKKVEAEESQGYLPGKKE